MKNLMAFTLAVAGTLAGFGASTTIDSINTMGVLKVDTKAGEKTLLNVPWTKLGSETDVPIPVSEYVSAGKVEDFDMLSIYRSSDAKFDGWWWDDVGKYWEGETSLTADFQLNRGDALLLETEQDAHVWLIGQYTTNTAVSTLVRDASKEVSTQLANPLIESLDLSGSVSGCIDGDQFYVIGAATETRYFYKDGEGWGVYETTTSTDIFGRTSTKTEFKKVATATVPACAGIWYISKPGSEEPKISWKSAK